MEKIAFISGETFLYWSPIILAIAAVAAALAFIGLHMSVGGKTVGSFLVVPLAMVLALFFGRLVHWYCRPDSYESLNAALMDYSGGSYALVGVFAGCVLAVCICRLVGALKNLPKALDCMALAGSLGICVGRLNHLFNGFDRGQVVDSIRSLPLVYPVENVLSGEPEYRLATFMLQSIVAGILFATLTVWYLVNKGRGKKRNGDACLLFLLCYGASQILLDSTRYDSLFLRSNGFVSVVQILGAVAVVVPIVLFSIRMVRARGWKAWYIGIWMGIVACLTCAGFMEYFVQRRGNQASQFYNVMTLCLLATVVISFGIRFLAVRGEEKKQA